MKYNEAWDAQLLVEGERVRCLLVTDESEETQMGIILQEWLTDNMRSALDHEALGGEVVLVSITVDSSNVLTRRKLNHFLYTHEVELESEPYWFEAKIRIECDDEVFEYAAYKR